MRIESPTYSARILGAPDIPVSLRDDSGEISLDASHWPHVDGTLTLAVEDPALLADLDPRDNRRLEVTAGGRVFDLGIREASPNRADSTVEVQLASDEALLDDFAQLVDDPTPRTHEASLRSVVNHVLGKIGASLDPGDEDADVTAYWRLSNLLPNPSFETDLTGWTAGAGATGLARNASATPVSGSWAALWNAASTASAWVDGPKFSVTPGRAYTFSAYMIATAARPARIRPAFIDANGVTLWDVQRPPTNIQTYEWTRVSILGAVAPAGAVACVFRLEYLTDISGRSIWADCCMVTEGDELVAYFDGAIPDDAHYLYEWSGTAHASNSTRTPVVERSPEALHWRAGTSGYQFLLPLVQAAGFRLVCNERREWTLRDEHYRDPGGLTYRYGVNVVDVGETLARAAEEWYDAAVFVYMWTDRDGIEQTRTDAFSLTATPTKVIRREIKAAYPGPGRAEYAVRRAQGRGRTVTVTAQATWDEAAEQPLTATLDGTPIQTGISNVVRFDLAMNEVTVTSRTTDTPAAAWVLIPVGERWIDSPAGESWTEEVI